MVFIYGFLKLRTRRLPVLFVFGKEEVDVEDCERAFRETFAADDEHILVLYDTLYSHCISEGYMKFTTYCIDGSWPVELPGVQ